MLSAGIKGPVLNHIVLWKWRGKPNVDRSYTAEHVNAMVRGEATREELKLVKTGTGWRLLWEAVMPQAPEEQAPTERRARRSKKPAAG